jgi:hypothetical protein
MSMENKQQSNSSTDDRHKAEPYVPSKEAREALSRIVAVMEGLSLPDRQHVRARIGELYFPGTGTTKRNRTRKKRKKVKPAAKQPWKAAWEESKEYRLWQDSKVPKGETPTDLQTEEYKRLQAAAFQVRAECKARFRAEPVSNPAGSE